jgi:hypothetical protein
MPMAGRSDGEHLQTTDGQATGRQQLALCRKNVVVLTALLHLSGQLANLRHQLRSLSDAL